MKIKKYDGPLSDTIDKFYDIYKDRLEVGDEKSIQCPNFQNCKEKFAAFETRNSDVWVISFPKAGTTWTQELVWCILNDLESDEAKKSLPERFPFFEWDSILPENLECLTSLTDDNPCSPGVTWKILQEMKDPRTIKSHLHLSLLPDNAWTAKPKIVYVCRDPRDVCVSYYYHSVKLDGFTGAFDDFFELFIHDVVFFAPFWRHVVDFWEKRHEPNVMFIRFEDLKQDLHGMIGKVSAFLDRSLTDNYVAKLEDHLSFSSMSNNTSVNNEVLNAVAVQNEKAKNIKFMRKGKVGDWKSHFNQDQIAQFKTWTEECLKSSDFPYYRDYA